MSTLSRLSLANRTLVALATVMILVFGAIAIPQLKQELYPSLEFPAISIIASYPGASPSIVERDVTNPIEQNLQGLQGLDTLTSYSNEGLSVVVVQYIYGTDLNQARQTITEQISKAQASLPTNVTPQVASYNFSSFPIIQLAITSDESDQALATALKQSVVPALAGVDGVAQVNITGVRNQIVTIDLDLKKLRAAGVSATQVQNILQANNITLPAGDLSANGQTLSIRAGNTFNSLDDLSNLIVGYSGVPASSGAGAGAGGSGFPGAGTGTGTGTGTTAGAGAVPTPVKLSDVATVQETLAPSTSLTRTNGKPSLGLSITKTTSGNTTGISKAIANKIPGLESLLGHNAQITTVSDQGPYVTQSINSLTEEGLVGALFAILVILAFLFSIRSTLVTAVSIPLSIIIALIGLWVGNFSLNILTLGGLTIAVGRVVDDSIVVLENIYRHLNSGEDKGIAVFSGVKEVAGAITASTLTTVAVFLPIGFTSGIVGELFRSFSVAVTVALLASLLVALTIIPVLAYWFLKSPKATGKIGKEAQVHEKDSVFERAYTPIIRWVTGHRAITLIVALLVLIGSFALAPLLQTNLFGSSGQNGLSISVQMPPATSLDVTDQAARQIETVLNSKRNEIKSYQVTVGSAGAFATLQGGGGSSNASFAVTLKDGVDEPTFEKNLRAQLATMHDIGTITVAASQQSGTNNSIINANVQANNDQALSAAAQMVFNEISKAPNVTDVSSNLTTAAPIIDVHVDTTKALQHGLTAVQVAQSLRQVYSGSTATHIIIGGQQQDVDLYIGTPVTSVEQLQDLLIPGTTGTVRLGDIATVTQTSGPTQVVHIGGQRTATISATVTSQNVGAVSSDIQTRLNGLHLPVGATVALGGVTASQTQAFSSLGIALLLAILLVYLVMVATFRSLLQPLILLVSIPFAATGSIILLVVTHTPLGVPALIGFLMLIGIVVTNAIVLLDRVRHNRQEGMDARSAVIEGGRRRVRPILMTAVATILALVPMAIGLSGSSGFISGPLAIVVIGGLATSTVLTLLLVPTLYVIAEGIRERISGDRRQPPEPQKTETEEAQPTLA